jgi:hypothetical protein
VGIIQYKALRYILSEFQHRPQENWENSWFLFCRAVNATDPHCGEIKKG